MALTGTPVVNKLIDVFSQYRFLDPRVFGTSFGAFRSRYFFMTGPGNHIPILNEAMLPELIQSIHSIAFRATKAECLDLPEMVDIIRYVDLEPPAMKAYRSLARDSYLQLGERRVTVTNVLTKLLRLSQFTGGSLNDDDGGPPRPVSEAKENALANIVDELLYAGKKFVIMARFVPELDNICGLLADRGVKYVCIRGGVRKRKALVKSFQNDPKVMAFVGQIGAAGLGITLTAADTMIFYSLDYNAANHEQARARIHRVGQCNRCTYMYLQAKDTLDEKVLKALHDKANLARLVIDDYRRGLNPFETIGGED